jgi:hypothetical protein
MLFGSTSYPSLPHQEKHMSWKTLPLKLWTLSPGKMHEIKYRAPEMLKK